MRTQECPSPSEADARKQRSVGRLTESRTFRLMCSASPPFLSSPPSAIVSFGGVLLSCGARVECDGLAVFGCELSGEGSLRTRTELSSMPPKPQLVCSYSSADYARRFNVVRVLVLNSPLSRVPTESEMQADNALPRARNAPAVPPLAHPHNTPHSHNLPTHPPFTPIPLTVPPSPSRPPLPSLPSPPIPPSLPAPPTRIIPRPPTLPSAKPPPSLPPCAPWPRPLSSRWC